jgi:hypothetical protein
VADRCRANLLAVWLKANSPLQLTASRCFVLKERPGSDTGLLPEPWMAFIPCFKYYSQIWIAYGEVASHVQDGNTIYTFLLHVPLKCLRLASAAGQWHDVLRDLGCESFGLYSADLHWNFTSIKRAIVHFDGKSCTCGCICDSPGNCKGWT